MALTKSTMIQNIPCTLVTGFLGAGKTTVINQLLSSKPADERWALLINEFGRIGIDGALLASAQDDNAYAGNIAIREVSGGCICCTSQLPLQIAITRLLSDHRPQRLIIEPTGLAHPRELIQQLSAPHWQTALNMQAVITVLSGVQWQQQKYRSHDGFQAHVRDADILVINRYTQLDADELKALQEWIAMLNAEVAVIWTESLSRTEDNSSNNTTALSTSSSTLIAQLTKPSHTISQQRATDKTKPNQIRTSLKPFTSLMSNRATENDQSLEDIEADTDLPYRYHEQQQDVLLGGWRLPAHYVFDADGLQEWLLRLPNWQRIKGLVNTSDGWLKINFTPDSLTITTASAQIDNRLEVILQSVIDNGVMSNKAEVENTLPLLSSLDWQACDNELMALVIEDTP
ncbi:CobW family GTP-binding protein [Psychrobacter sp. PAMC 21119]|uniref:CobW family GTP-binding protein n=1 Tax=Psychrobacter sp. PAMC 21119 TaxID=1112209 RepID=UPI000287F8AE|nr:CobW family GTP-binding protein [Psychrobacter sp. PAMC 21119]